MHRRLSGFLFATVASCSFGCGPATPTQPTAEPLPRATRGYVLISLDTLRADHLGLYGYERNTSPFLDQLAKHAVVFDNAFVHYPSTLTSHMSIFTGLYPAEHGVYPPDSVLSSEIETLPEVFQRHGFRTAGITEGGYVHGRFGFRRGFDLFRARDRGNSGKVEQTFEQGLRFLRGLGQDEPFFLFLHTYAVHAPYDPPDAYRDLFWQGPPPPDAFDPTGPELSRVNATGKTLSPEVLDYFRALYDAEIRHLDDVLKSFFTELGDLGLAGDTTVILTSDHGEEFFDHGKVNHTQLYREVLRVPLLVVHPDFESSRRHQPPVTSIDLAPTLYELARLEAGNELSGTSLTPHFHGAPGNREIADGRQEAYAELSGGVRSLVSSDAGRLFHLLVHQPEGQRWWTRRLRIDVTDSGPVKLELRSFREPRTIEVTDGTQVFYSSTVAPKWTRVELDLPSGGGRRSLTITSPTCTRSEPSKDLKKVRCFSFQVRGVPLGRAELYDLAADPREASDLAPQRTEDVRALYSSLAQYKGRDKSEVRAEELDEKLRQELEALGYLQ